MLDRSQLAARIDQVIARADRDAVRVRKDRLAEREVLVGDLGDGLAEIVATVYAPDGHAVADRLTALAHTVCPDDPRTMAQRRSDGFGALAAGADRLACRCGRADCPAGANTATAVVIHVIAEQATVEGSGHTPAAMIGYDGLIPAELIADLATPRGANRSSIPATPRRTGLSAVEGVGRVRPPPRHDVSLPELRGPATDCDIDHVIPYGDGGPTHASNLSCMPISSPPQDVLGLARRTTPRRHADLDRPTGHKTVTHPGSALIFPTLCAPTGPLPCHPHRPRRRQDRQDAPASAHPHPTTHRGHPGRTPRQPPTPHQPPTTTIHPRRTHRIPRHLHQKTQTHHPSERGYSACMSFSPRGRHSASTSSSRVEVFHSSTVCTSQYAPNSAISATSTTSTTWLNPSGGVLWRHG